MLRPFLVIGVLSAATGAYADPQPLDGSALKALAGSLVEIDTPLGTKLPVRFGTDGLVSAQAGELAPLLGSEKDRGRWWVDNDKICTKWFRWFDAEVRCIQVSQDGTRLYWRKDDGETGTATLIEEPAAKGEAVVVAAAAPAPAPQKTSAADAAKETVKASAAPPTPVSSANVGGTAEASEAQASEPKQPMSPADERPPVVLAGVAAAETPEPDTMMRFGGEGLLAASARAGQDAASKPSADTAAKDVRIAGLAPTAPTPDETASINEKLSPLRREVRATKPRSPAPVTLPKPADPAPVEAKERRLEPDKTKGLEVANFETAPRAEAERRETSRNGNVPQRAARQAPFYRVQGVEAYDVLNVRRGPSENYDPIASIPPTGRRVEITGRCRDDWCPIRYGRVRGWVNSYYLVAEGAPGSSSQSQVYLAKP